MRRFVLAFMLAVAGVLVIAPFATGSVRPGSSSGTTDEYGVRNCSQGLQICTEVKDSIGYEGAYTGHDEPSLLFYSEHARGAGTPTSTA